MQKVMLVEDNQTMFDLLNTLFVLEGYEVSSDIGEQDFLASVKQNEPDLIMLDVHLRVVGGVEVNGFELLRQIRSDEILKDIKVLMLSLIHI